MRLLNNHSILLNIYSFDKKHMPYLLSKSLAGRSELPVHANILVEAGETLGKM